MTENPILVEAIRGWRLVCGEQAILNALADVCQQAADTIRKEPMTTNGRINANRIRELAKLVVDAKQGRDDGKSNVDSGAMAREAPEQRHPPEG